MKNKIWKQKTNPNCKRKKNNSTIKNTTGVRTTATKYKKHAPNTSVLRKKQSYHAGLKNNSEQEPQRLQKLLAQAGYASRRTIESWIVAGKIQINNRVATLGDFASQSDRITLDKKLLNLRKHTVIRTEILLYNKKLGEVCARVTDATPTIYDNLPKLQQGKWISVGRLDINSSGLLLLTNDGELANKLMHPRLQINRVYKVRLRGKYDASLINSLTSPTDIGDSQTGKIDKIVTGEHSDDKQNFWLTITLSEGKYREIRRLFATIYLQVNRLIRIEYANIKLPINLRMGRYDVMSEQTIEKLKNNLALKTQTIT